MFVAHEATKKNQTSVNIAVVLQTWKFLWVGGILFKLVYRRSVLNFQIFYEYFYLLQLWKTNIFIKHLFNFFQHCPKSSSEPLLRRLRNAC